MTAEEAKAQIEHDCGRLTQILEHVAKIDDPRRSNLILVASYVLRKYKRLEAELNTLGE